MLVKLLIEMQYGEQWSNSLVTRNLICKGTWKKINMIDISTEQISLQKTGMA